MERSEHLLHDLAPATLGRLALAQLVDEMFRESDYQVALILSKYMEEQTHE
jgi:hypothetical protein